MSTATHPIFCKSAAALPSVVQQLRQRLTRLCMASIPVKAFEVVTPDGAAYMVGAGKPFFTVRLLTPAGEAALQSLDELSIAEAFMNGGLDIEGDVLQSLRYRTMLSDRHPLRYLAATYLVPLLRGQARSDEKWIKSHYDIDADFFILWLDRRIRGYSHGMFHHDDEPLEDGMERKFRYAMNAANIKPGDRVLDIGGGWGSFLEFAGSQGVRVTSVTISAASEKFMTDLIHRRNLPCQAVKQHFLEYRNEVPFDAIVNLGVTEHLPGYKRTLHNYTRLLKPGGRVYLDCYTGERHGMPSFITKWIYEGNTSPLNFKLYMAALETTPLELIEAVNDRHNYFLTCKKWAENLEAIRDEVVSRWGLHLYQRFRLYLWAAANSFDSGTLCAHHMVLEKPCTQ